jgi:hypothetical protein
VRDKSAPSVLNFVSSSSAKRMQAKRPSCTRCAMRNRTRSQWYTMQKERRSDKRSQPRFGWGISQSWQKLTTKTWGHHDSLGYSLRLSFFDGTRDVLQMSPTLVQMSSTLLLRLSHPNIFIIVSDDLLAWKT